MEAEVVKCPAAGAAKGEEDEEEESRDSAHCQKAGQARSVKGQHQLTH